MTTPVHSDMSVCRSDERIMLYARCRFVSGQSATHTHTISYAEPKWQSLCKKVEIQGDSPTPISKYCTQTSSLATAPQPSSQNTNLASYCLYLKQQQQQRYHQTWQPGQELWKRK